MLGGECAKRESRRITAPCARSGCSTALNPCRRFIRHCPAGHTTTTDSRRERSEGGWSNPGVIRSGGPTAASHHDQLGMLNQRRVTGVTHEAVRGRATEQLLTHRNARILLHPSGELLGDAHMVFLGIGNGIANRAAYKPSRDQLSSANTATSPMAGDLRDFDRIRQFAAASSSD